MAMISHHTAWTASKNAYFSHIVLPEYSPLGTSELMLTVDHPGGFIRDRSGMGGREDDWDHRDHQVMWVVMSGCHVGGG